MYTDKELEKLRKYKDYLNEFYNFETIKIPYMCKAGIAIEYPYQGKLYLRYISKYHNDRKVSIDRLCKEMHEFMVLGNLPRKCTEVPEGLLDYGIEGEKGEPGVKGSND